MAEWFYSTHGAREHSASWEEFMQLAACLEESSGWEGGYDEPSHFATAIVSAGR